MQVVLNLTTIMEPSYVMMVVSRGTHVTNTILGFFFRSGHYASTAVIK